MLFTGSTTSGLEQKAHQFRVHSWRGGAWCDFCRNWMWGLTQQGVKCEDCGFAAHKRCSERVFPDCRPDLKYVRRMFAVDLTTLVMAHSVDVPKVVCKCVNEVEVRGLRSEGIYRIPGYHDEIESLRVAFDAKGDADLTAVEDINSVAGLLKLYFRLLPIPLVTYSAYRSLMEALSRRHATEADRLREIPRIVQELPVAHYATLKYLVGHLAKVIALESSNRMSVENLAKIFVPGILRNPNPVNSIALASHEQFIVQFLILKQTEVFSR